MMTNVRLLRLAVLLYCGWQAADLLTSWQMNSAERFSPAAFALWLSPTLLALLSPAPNQRGELAVLATSLVMSCLGQVVSLNLLQHLAFLLVLVGSFPVVRPRAVWLLSGVLWLPASGWLCNSLIGDPCGLSRAIGSGLLSFIVLGVTCYRLPITRHLRSTKTVARVSVVALMCLGFFFPVSAKADSFTYSPVQSPARPFGLDVVDLVGLAGSDAASADFQENKLPEFLELIDRNLGEKQGVENDDLILLDPSKLRLEVDADVRAYFVGEGAGYHNTFGFNTQGGGIDSGDPLLIFPDASSPNSYLSSGGQQRTVSEPLMAGDFVELGSLEAGTKLDFFLIANGANGGTNVFSTDQSVNPDGINHVVAFPEVESPYILVGFEDLYGGGDEDYNDLLVALYIGEENVDALIRKGRLGGVPAPEPGSLVLILAGFGGWLYIRRRKARQGETSRQTPESSSLIARQASFSEPRTNSG